MLTITMLRHELLVAYRHVNRVCWEGALEEPRILHTLRAGEPIRFELITVPTLYFSAKDAIELQGFKAVDVARVFVEMKFAISGLSEQVSTVISALKSFEELCSIIY